MIVEVVFLRITSEIDLVMWSKARLSSLSYFSLNRSVGVQTAIIYCLHQEIKQLRSGMLVPIA